ncbi:hypothetical protein [Bacillus sp. FJAT-27245]|uniref:hypothetical protein n=1 Tax=Bacillus sp. FJAT-27245 TaxID=1684144 RepID=UPI0006A7C445|nr:hypothetical protein [Bacillus sp. FJAT-27245]
MGRRVFWIIITAVFGVLFFEKGMSLLGAINTVDGEGIGISLAGFEVNDRVPAGQIIYYSIGFILVGAILFCTAFTMVFKSIRQIAFKGN